MPLPTNGHRLEPGERLSFEALTDLDARMRFGTRSLLVTDRRVVVEDRSLALGEVDEAWTEPLVGGGALWVKLKSGERVRLVHFSSSLFERFGRAAEAIGRLSKGEGAGVEEAVDARCEKCGRLLPNRKERCPFCIKYWEALRRILAYLGPYKWRTAWCVLVTTTNKALQLLPPLLMMTLVDKVLPAKDGALLTKVVLGLLAVQGLQAALTIYSGNELAWLGSRLGTDIRSHVFRSVQKLEVRFFDRHHSGQVFSRIMNDSTQLQNFLVEGFPYIAEQLIMLFGVLGILLWHSPTLTLLVMIPVPAMFAGQYLFWRLVRSLSHKWWNHQALLHNRLNESLHGVRVIKAFSQEDKEIGRFEKQNERMFETRWKADRFWMLFNPTMSFIVSSGTIIVWWVGGKRVLEGSMTLGTLFAFNAYLWMFYGPLQWFNQVNNWLTRAFAGAERIFETVDSTPEPYQPPDAVALVRPRGELEFRNVSFSYDKGLAALRSVSFKVSAGERIGLVGKSGSGKSTLLALLCRFYDADEGEILLDGVPLKRLRLDDLRRGVGLVLQDPFLFSSSIADNIRYSRPDAPLAEVVEAARAANAHDFIVKKGDAYDTRVGERGNRLSGGEKQRISIARALLRDPAILLLDEATSSVDGETEAKIQEALTRLEKGRTTLIAAHRLSTLRRCHRIFVLEEGRLVESGPHKELLSRDGPYKRMVEAQEDAWRKSRDSLPVGGNGGDPADEEKEEKDVEEADAR